MFKDFYRKHGSEVESAKRKFNVEDKIKIITHNDSQIFAYSIELLKEATNGFSILNDCFKDLEKENAESLVDLLNNLINSHSFKSDINLLESLYINISNAYYIDNSKYIPYIGGYSDSCKIIYIDNYSFSQLTQKKINK